MLPEDEPPSSKFKEITETLLTTYRFHVLGGLVVFLLLGGIVLYFKGFFSGTEGKVEILSATSSAEVKSTATTNAPEIVVEISGEIEKPGVYHFSPGARIDDLLQQAGGVTEEADTEWLAKALNRAAKLSDGQKLYIPARNASQSEAGGPRVNNNQQSSYSTAKETSTNSEENVSRTIISEAANRLTNINSASLAELDKLPGIGPVYAQKIVDHRPYSDVSELKSKKVVPNATFEKIKDKISTY